MKIRGPSELVDYLASRKKERARELTSLLHDLTPKSGEPNSRIRRAAIVLAYAHLEGFIKDASQAYVKLVFYKKRCFANLSPNFQALVCREELLIAQGATRRIKPHLAVIKRTTDNMMEGCVVDPKSAIDTESNLSSEVFENICLSVGIDYSNWSSDGPFLDDLVRSRCQVAHGELFTPDTSYAREVVNFSIGSIDKFTTEIENAALNQNFLRR